MDLVVQKQTLQIVPKKYPIILFWTLVLKLLHTEVIPASPISSLSDDNDFLLDILGQSGQFWRGGMKDFSLAVGFMNTLEHIYINMRPNFSLFIEDWLSLSSDWLSF